MILQIAALGMILMEQSNPDLVIETAVSRERGNAVVTASLKNRGKLPLRVVLEDYFCRIETCLRDPQGKEIQARDDRAAQGAQLRGGVTRRRDRAGAASNHELLAPARQRFGDGRSSSWELPGTLPEDDAPGRIQL
jgi:hypothetical protein